MTIDKTAALSAGLGSVCCAFAEAVLVITVPGAAVGMTLIVIVAVAPAASEGIDRVRTPAL